jgi:DNA-binding NarL/FixJ family response regulator
VFDAGTKKTCRHNQYFGTKAAQQRVQQREGGIIWHTQGSGKSLTMVWLAKWIREHATDARILIITDRTELDEQIEGVFQGVDEAIYRTTSSADLIRQAQRHHPLAAVLPGPQIRQPRRSRCPPGHRAIHSRPAAQPAQQLQRQGQPVRLCG